jgi:hypothetical protein
MSVLAKRLMSIATNPVMANRAPVPYLPGGYSVLYELSRLEPSWALEASSEPTSPRCC